MPANGLAKFSSLTTDFEILILTKHRLLNLACVTNWEIMCECLKFKPYRKKDINWRALAEDDFIAKIELIGITYTLRVEQMDIDSWWACLYINESQEWVNDTWIKTEKQAKLAVLRALNKHRARA